MKISCQWLNTFVEAELSVSDLAERLTMAGLEVEEIAEFGQGYNRIVVGEIKEIEPLQNPDSLKICRVDSGKALLNIVCGAPNISLGDKVPLALPGAVLEDGTNIRRAEIKGQWSEGMICSSAELGLEEEIYGAMILPREAQVGQEIAEALDLTDTVLELSITPNRSDCLSILGVAREVAAISKKPLKKSAFDCLETDPSIFDFTSVTIQDPELCPRYTARLILDVQIKPSPLWMQKRLKALGLRPINNVVDITNYVMVELGQPLHAFDFDCLEEKRILVRRAFPKEDFLSLDGVSHSLNPEMLVIADAKKTIALGGVIGGWNSQVTLKTRNILLESAYFNPRSIRRTSKSLGLQTDASYRFERGIDPEGSVPALNRAAELIRRLSDGKLTRGIIDCYEKPTPQQEVTLRIGRLNKVLGTEISEKEAASILGQLGMEISETEKDKTLNVTVPSFRRDLTREIDLIEEVARHHGYDRIPTTLPSVCIAPSEQRKEEALERRVRGWIQGYGVSEVITYSFISQESLDTLRIPEGHPLKKTLVLTNPISREWKVLRTTLLPGLLQVIALNFKRKAKGLRVFELGRVFRPLSDEGLPQEKRYLAGAISGSTESPLWRKTVEEDYFIVKGLLEGLLEELHLSQRDYQPSPEPYLHPYKSAQIKIEDQVLGQIGELHPAVSSALDLSQQICVFEIDYDLAISSTKKAVSFIPLPKFPALYRDLSILVDEQATCRQIEKTIAEAGTQILRRAEIFDVYAGNHIPSGKKSLAYSLTFQANDRTLTDEEVNGIYTEIVAALQQTWGGRLRE